MQILTVRKGEHAFRKSCFDMGKFFRSLVNAPLEFRIQHFQLPRLPVKLSENPGGLPVSCFVDRL